MLREFRFSVVGLPVPQGSLKAVTWRAKDGRSGTNLISDNQTELLRWRGRLIDAAREARDAAGIDSPLAAAAVVARFRFPRPLADYGTGKNAGQLRDGAPREKVTGPDLDKLVRAVFDSLKEANVVLDDRVIVEVLARKEFGDPGATIHVGELELLRPARPRAVAPSQPGLEFED